MKLPLSHAIKLLETAREQEMREKLYRLWLARYPLYTKDNYETFDDFYEKANPAKIVIDTRSKDEIMAEILGGE
jgi:hypothetical protein